MLKFARFFSLYNLAVTLSGMNCVQFRGLLVQARENVTGDDVGTFSGFTPNTRASDCMPSEVTINNWSQTQTTPSRFMNRQQISMHAGGVAR